jgi:hypothetical protein
MSPQTTANVAQSASRHDTPVSRSTLLGADSISATSRSSCTSVSFSSIVAALFSSSFASSWTRRQGHTGVRAFVRAHPQGLSPAPVLGKNSGVAHYNEEGLGSSDGDVESLGIRHKFQVVQGIKLKEAFARAYGRDNDDAALLALEFLRRADHQFVAANFDAVLAQEGGELCHLALNKQANIPVVRSSLAN